MPVRTIAKTKARKLDLDDAVEYMIHSIAEMSRKMAESKAETDAKIAESDAKIAESDAKMAKSKAETDAKIAETDAKMAKSRAETDAKMAKSRAETDAKMAKSRAETDAKMAASAAERDRAIERLSDKIDKLSAEIRNGFSNAGNKLGYLVEFIVAPGIRREMNKLNHNFKYAKANRIFWGIKNGKKSMITEVDLFLHNGTEVMAVEVKTTLGVKEVKDHIDRLNTLRKFENDTKIQGKNLFGAIVGVFIDDDVYEFASKNGLYVLEILEDEKRMIIQKPAKCRVW